MNKARLSHEPKLGSYIVFSAFLLGAAILAAHLFFLQFDPQVSATYRVKVEQRWHSFEVPQGKRGNIYYRDGSLLAGNQKVARVIIDPKLICDLPQLSAALAEHLQQPADVLTRKINACNGRFLVLADGLPIASALAIDRLDLPGVFTRYYFGRVYPHADYGAAATVGYAGRNPEQRIGLESTCDYVLTGRDGRVTYRKDANRRRLPDSEVNELPKQDGQDITTTLHPAIQLICEEELRKAVARNRAEWACVLVMDPRTGEVLGAATDPYFDPNLYAAGQIGVERNVLVQSAVEPGSTAKPVLAAYAIDRDWLDLNKRYVCNRYLTIDGHTIREADAGHVVGGSAGVPLEDIIVHSSNIGMAQVATALKQDRVRECYAAMGFFKQTGIELPAERRGWPPFYYEQRRHKQNLTWPRITLANSGFGQGLTATPLQLAAAYCTIANGGYAVKPTLLINNGADSVAPLPEPDTQEGLPALPEGEIVVTAPEHGAVAALLKPLSAVAQAAQEEPVPGGRRRVLSKKTCDLMTKWLAEVVERGTGKKAKLEHFRAAGKTGTAQVPASGGGYQKGAYSATFVGYFPVESPRYVILAMFVKPKGLYYGGEVAAPVFKIVGDRISYLDQLGLVEASNAD